SKDTAWLVFTGDFLFVGDVGRPDLLGEREREKLAHQLYQSVFKTLSPLPDFTEVFPAHGAGSLCGKAIGSRRSSSIGFERNFNVALRSSPEPQWTESLLKGMPPAPPYFRQMKKLNAAGPPILGDKLPGSRRITASELRDISADSVQILDLRAKEAFASAHVPGSISIPLAPNLPSWAGWVLSYDKPIVLVGASSDDIREAVIHLIRIGMDRIDGFLDGGIDAWESAGYPLESLRTISAQQLSQELSGATPPFVLDVRTDGEWQSGHIDGALHIQGGLVTQHLDQIPRDREVAVFCGSGYRSSIFGSILQKRGYRNVTSVLGGMTAWNASRLPVSR
ncbi:MAG: rhodanese-like domain-containing protein, partial [Tepidisphaeraceae bacterium]